MKKIFLFLPAVLFILAACGSMQTACADYAACRIDRAPAKIAPVQCTARDTAADCLWFEPSQGQAPIVDYIIKYKKAGDASWTTNNEGVSTDAVISLSGLTNGIEYSLTVQARNMYGDSPESDIVTFTPHGAIDGIDDVLSGVVAYWNANNYSGSGPWLNEATSPADGSAQSAYNLTPSGSFFTNGCFEFDGTNTLSLAANTAFINALGKTSAGNDWGAVALVDSPPPNTVMTLIGTADVVADHGTVWRADSSGNHKIDQYNGTAVVTVSGNNTVPFNSRVLISASFDQDSNTLKFARNADTYTIKTASWTADTADATYTLKVGSEGNGGSKTAGWRLCGLALIDHDLTDTELAAANDWFDAEFPAAPATAPGQVYSVFTMPKNNGVHLAWDLLEAANGQKDGGSAITDYIIETKPSSGSTWTTISDGVNANTYYTWNGGTNGTAQDFRIKAVNAVGTGTVSDPVTETPAAAGVGPYDLADWKITEPVDETTQLREGTNAREIEPPAITTYSSAWFGQVGNTYVFKCTYPGATTSSNAQYSRSELRGLFNGREFAATDDNEDIVTFAVTECPTSLGETRTYVHQNHDDGPPLFKIGYHCKPGTAQDKVRLVMKTTDTTVTDDVAVDILTGVTRGTPITSRVVYDGDGSSHGGQQTVDFYINGVLKRSQAINKTGANGLMYNKRGNYCQAGPIGSKTTVIHYANP